MSKGMLYPVQLMSVRMAMEDVIRSVRILHWHSTASVEMNMFSIQMERAVMVIAYSDKNDEHVSIISSFFQISMNVVQETTGVNKGA